MLDSAIERRTLTALDQELRLAVIGFAGAVVQLAGTWVATLAFEATADGVTWVAINAIKSDGSSVVTTATATGAYVMAIAGFRLVRVRVSAFTSGAIDATVSADPGGPGGGSSSGGGGGGTSSSFDDTFPATGTAAGGYNLTSGDMKPLAIDDDGNLKVVVSGAGSAVTIADGADVAEGAKADAPATDSTSAWTVIAVLKGLYARLTTLITNTTTLVTSVGGGYVRQDSTATIAKESGGNLATIAGTVTAGKAAVSIADGSDVTEGAVADVKVTGDNAGTVSAKLRGINYLLALAIDTANSWMKVSIQAGSAIIGKVSIDQTTPGTTNGVQVNAALPAGANAIGKLAANSGIDIGDVDVTSVVPGTGATNLGKAEDAAHSSGDTGVASWGVANEAQSTFGADGDYTPHATDTKGNALMVGNLAHDAVDAGNPVKVGAKAASAAPTAVAAADRVNFLADLWGRLFVRHGMQAPAASTWTGVHVPATATQATKTQASAGAGKRNVCTGFTATLTSNGTAPTPTTPVTIKVIDGASGGGTLLWQTNVNMPAVAGGIVSFNRSGLWLVGSQATAITIEFSAASPTNTYQSVAFDGVIIEE